MIGTVEEAMQWWCPLVRKRHAGSAINRVSSNPLPDDCFCIGDRCAAWRWAVKDPATYTAPPGYCGAFGRPEAE